MNFFTEVAAPTPPQGTPIGAAPGAMVAAYTRVLPALRARVPALRDEVAAVLGAGTGLKLHSVTARLKTPESLAAKLARPDRSYRDLWDVTDLVGIRVITYFQDDVEAVGRAVEERLPITLEHSIDKRRRADASTFGYRSLHYVCELGAADDAVPAGARFEIQVRTVLEHAWAEIEHDLGYKAQHELPVALRRRFSRIASLLEIADHEFTAVRQELHDYSSKLPERLAGGDDVRIDRLSLGPLLEQPLVRDIDAAIAERLRRPLDEAPFFPDYLARMLVLSGIERANEALELLSARRDRVLALVEPYFTFAAREWLLSPAKMDSIRRGYSLFFLAHVALLQSPLLGISKADRLARFYGELDYPDDPRAAQRVAGALLAAFQE